MCGIAGVWGGPSPKTFAGAMVERLSSRGPDGTGAWFSEPNGLAFGHKRLAIIGAAAGAQPFVSRCGRFVLIFNGEIYNHERLRLDLESEGLATSWCGGSDTETLLIALSHWGIEKCLAKLVGMFAFALWDSSDKLLYLARDRLGEKPLYYGRIGDAFIFGSELKALKAHPNWEGEIDRDVIPSFLRFSYVPAPWSIYKGILKLLPGHFLVVKDQGQIISDLQCYWDLQEVAKQTFDYASLSADTLIDELEGLLLEAVQGQMVSDVPIGAFLSGGVDSTTIAALMQAQSSKPVKTFTIGFSETGFDEAVHAKEIASYLGTQHTEMYVSPRDCLDVIPKLPLIYDEPYADVSQIPTYLVSQLARDQVTVSLSGDGGDELFCGYNRYVSGYAVWNKLKTLPQPVRNYLANFLKLAPDSALNVLQSILPKRFYGPSLTGLFAKLSAALAHQDGYSYYYSLVSRIDDPLSLTRGSCEAASLLENYRYPGLLSLQDQMMFWDMLTYLPDDILTKVDRASMAVSLETRTPLLDHRVVEFAWRVPLTFKHRRGVSKWLLREVLYRHVPPRLIERPKMGFGVPIEHWLRGPLRDWGETLLNAERIAQEGYLDPIRIRQMWDELIRGKGYWQYQIWNVLMFQSWLELESRS